MTSRLMKTESLLENSFVEECWFLKGIRLGGYAIATLHHVARGSVGSVTFQWEEALQSKSLIGWFHTHPGHKFYFPSSTDNRTMRSWVKGYGRAFYCGIRCETGGERLYYYHKEYDRANKRIIVRCNRVRYIRISSVVIILGLAGPWAITTG